MKWVTLSMGAPFILLLITFKAGKELSDIIGTLAGTFWIVYIVWCFNRFEKEQALAILCANVFCLGILFLKCICKYIHIITLPSPDMGSKSATARTSAPGSAGYPVRSV